MFIQRLLLVSFLLYAATIGRAATPLGDVVPEAVVAVAVWNRTGDVTPISVSFAHAPAGHGQLNVYRIDADHCVDAPLASVAAGGEAWSGTLGPHAVVIIRLERGRIGR